MPITMKKVRLDRTVALSATSAILELTVQVGDIAGLPPIKGAAQILLSILKAIEVCLPSVADCYPSLKGQSECGQY